MEYILTDKKAKDKMRAYPLPKNRKKKNEAHCLVLEKTLDVLNIYKLCLTFFSLKLYFSAFS